VIFGPALLSADEFPVLLKGLQHFGTKQGCCLICELTQTLSVALPGLGFSQAKL